MVEAIGKAYKPWIILSLIVLVVSLALLAADVVGAFLNFTEKSMPLWVVVIGTLSALGVMLGFGGLFFLLATAGWREWRAARRVQVLPPK